MAIGVTTGKETTAGVLDINIVCTYNGGCRLQYRRPSASVTTCLQALDKPCIKKDQDVKDKKES